MSTRLGQAIQGFKKLPEAWRAAFSVWLVARLAMGLWGVVIWRLAASPAGPSSPANASPATLATQTRSALIDVWFRWDALHYLAIAQEGYARDELTAFHPLFPLLSHFLSRALGIDEALALIAVSNLSALMALVLLYQVVLEEFPASTAWRTLVALMSFPGAFFLFAPYPMASALALVLLSYRSARLGQWLLSVVSGLAAGLCHSTTVPLAVGLAWIVWMCWRRPAHPTKLPLAQIPVAPLLGQVLFLAWRAWAGHTPWLRLHGNLWGLVLQPPWEALTAIPKVLRSPYFALTGWINLLIYVLAVLSALWGLRRLPSALAAYQIGAILFLSSTDIALEPLGSWIRYALMLFPMFLCLAIWQHTSRRAMLAFALSFALLLYFTALFIMEIWVG